MYYDSWSAKTRSSYCTFYACTRTVSVVIGLQLLDVTKLQFFSSTLLSFFSYYVLQAVLEVLVKKRNEITPAILTPFLYISLLFRLSVTGFQFCSLTCYVYAIENVVLMMIINNGIIFIFQVKIVNPSITREGNLPKILHVTKNK